MFVHYITKSVDLFERKVMLARYAKHSTTNAFFIMYLDTGLQTKVKDENNTFDQTHLRLLYRNTYEKAKSLYKSTTHQKK